MMAWTAGVVLGLMVGALLAGVQRRRIAELEEAVEEQSETIGRLSDELDTETSVATVLSVEVAELTHALRRCA